MFKIKDLRNFVVEKCGECDCEDLLGNELPCEKFISPSELMAYLSPLKVKKSQD